MKCDLFKKVFCTEKRKWLIKKFLALCNSHIAIHLFMIFFCLDLGTTTITLVSVLGILLGVISTAIIIKKDMSLIKLSIYNFSFFVILGIILFSGIFGIFDIFSLVVVIIALVVIALIFCVVRSLSFGIRISDFFYERIVFVLTNPLIHFLGYFYALFYEMSKEPFHFPWNKCFYIPA